MFWITSFFPYALMCSCVCMIPFQVDVAHRNGSIPRSTVISFEWQVLLPSHPGEPTCTRLFPICLASYGRLLVFKLTVALINTPIILHVDLVVRPVHQSKNVRCLSDSVSRCWNMQQTLIMIKQQTIDRYIIVKKRQ